MQSVREFHVIANKQSSMLKRTETRTITLNLK